MWLTSCELAAPGIIERKTIYIAKRVLNLQLMQKDLQQHKAIHLQKGHKLKNMHFHALIGT